MNATHYFGNTVIREEPDCQHFIVACGCGCGGEGQITYSAETHIAERYGAELRGAVLTFEGHGPGVPTPKGGVFWLPSPPPVVIFEWKGGMTVSERIAAANAALRGMSRGTASA